LVGGDQPDGHIERRCLAGAVGAEQPDDLALLHVDGDVVHHRACLVFLHQILGAEDHLGFVHIKRYRVIMRGGKGKPGDECRKRPRPHGPPAHAVQQQPPHRLGSAFLFLQH
jgi:hypothetical protein